MAPMTVEMALHLGKALAATLPRRGESFKVLIGKDTRRSGYMFEAAIAAGVNAMNGEVMYTGPLPTPAVAQLTTSMRADAGVVISASHNPYDDNGIKIFGADGFKLADALEASIETYLDDPHALDSRVDPAAIGRSRRIDDAQGRYNAFLKSNFERELTLDGLTLAVDTANGAAYRVARAVYEELGAHVIQIGDKPDGYNINKDVGALHPQACAALVRQTGAHVGITFDGDADRLILIDERGAIVDGDAIMAMLAIDLSSQGRLAQNTLVTTVMSNLGLHLALQRRGIQTVQTRVGDRYVVEAMRAGGYCLGGEQSGHVVMLDHTTTGDALLTSLRVLSLLCRSGRPLSELAAVMEKLPQVLINRRVARKVPLESLPQTQALMAEIAARYGSTGRVLVRYSGTEPVCRVMLEGPDRTTLERDAQSLADLVVRETAIES